MSNQSNSLSPTTKLFVSQKTNAITLPAPKKTAKQKKNFKTWLVYIFPILVYTAVVIGLTSAAFIALIPLEFKLSFLTESLENVNSYIVFGTTGCFFLLTLLFIGYHFKHYVWVVLFFSIVFVCTTGGLFLLFIPGKPTTMAIDIFAIGNIVFFAFFWIYKLTKLLLQIPLSTTTTLGKYLKKHKSIFFHDLYFFFVYYFFNLFIILVFFSFFNRGDQFFSAIFLSHAAPFFYTVTVLFSALFIFWILWAFSLMYFAYFYDNKITRWIINFQSLNQIESESTVCRCRLICVRNSAALLAFFASISRILCKPFKLLNENKKRFLWWAFVGGVTIAAIVLSVNVVNLFLNSGYETPFLIKYFIIDKLTIANYVTYSLLAVLFVVINFGYFWFKFNLAASFTYLTSLVFKLLIFFAGITFFFNVSWLMFYIFFVFFIFFYYDIFRLHMFFTTQFNSKKTLAISEPALPNSKKLTKAPLLEKFLAVVFFLFFFTLFIAFIEFPKGVAFAKVVTLLLEIGGFFIMVALLQFFFWKLEINCYAFWNRVTAWFSNKIKDKYNRLGALPEEEELITGLNEWYD